MVRDLLKTPLLAVFYASFFFLLEGFMVNGLPVFSESYWETAPHYGTDLMGYLMLLLWAFLLSVIICLAFHFMQDTKILSLIFLGITIIGYQLIIPAVMPVWYGDRAGILTTADIIFDAARGAVCTVVLIILAVLLIHPGKAVNPGGKKAPAEYKIKMPALIARVLALPFIYLVLYLFSWYFLGWRNEAVRAYSEGPEYSESLVTAVVNLLLRDNSVLPVALCIGLLYVLFALPLMTRLASNRGIFAALMFLLAMLSGVRALIPVQWIPAQLSFLFFLRDASLAALYSISLALLLHFSYKKQMVAAAEASGPTKKRAPKDIKVAGVSAQQAADTLKSTMK